MSENELEGLLFVIFNIFLPVCFVGICYLCGIWSEKKHYKSIIQREKMLINRPGVTIGKTIVAQQPIARSWLVVGSVAIGQDYFKRFLAMLRNLVGGRVKSYETLIDRARREAILRMKENARGADIILNLRLETSSIGKQSHRKKTMGCVEAFAYGTAVVYKKGSV